MDEMGYCPIFTAEYGDDMDLHVIHKGKVVLCVDVLLGIEQATHGRSRTIKTINELIKHVNECDNSPWLKKWQDEKHEMLAEVLSNG